MYDPLIIRDTCQMQSRGHVSNFALLFATEQKNHWLEKDQKMHPNKVTLSLNWKREDDSNFNYLESRLSSSNHLFALHLSETSLVHLFMQLRFRTQCMTKKDQVRKFKLQLIKIVTDKGWILLKFLRNT